MNSLSVESKLLECPVCFNIETGPKYNCKTGHTICGKCRFKLEVCALCGETFTTSRNYTLESLIDSLKIGSSEESSLAKFCPFKSEGCPEMSSSAIYIYEHSQICDFRTISCALDYHSDCYQKDVKYSNFFDHLKQNHQIQGIDNYTGPFTKIDFCDKLNEDIKWKPFYIIYDGNVFFRRCQLIDGVIYWWFSILGSEALAEKYKARIRSVKDTQDIATIPSYEFCLPVLPFRMQTKHVFISGKYASMTLYQLQTYCTPNGNVNVDASQRIHAYTWEFQISFAKKNLDF